jgi:DNA-binding CsgD family transcriptional regulator
MASARARALLASARGDLGGAAEAAREALVIGEEVELRLEFARSLLVVGQIERRRRRKAAAREHLQRALEIFEASGARLWAERARGELERAKLRRATEDALTESEHRVAELAASGLTNRKVAALFMSPKTVEANLARAYRKLGVHSRAQLGARAVELGRNHTQT